LQSHIFRRTPLTQFSTGILGRKAHFGFKPWEFGELAFITGIFSARRVNKGSRKEGRRTGASWPDIKGVNRPGVQVERVEIVGLQDLTPITLTQG
jgi:hypothetical protein